MACLRVDTVCLVALAAVGFAIDRRDARYPEWAKARNYSFFPYWP